MRLLEGLRASTAEIHERLHHAPALYRLTDASVTLDYYYDALKKFYGFYKPLEERYASTSFTELHHDFLPGIAIKNLQNDFESHHICYQDVNLITTTASAFTVEESLAYLYMREGSNLGGKVISKNLHEKLHLAPEKDNKFFWGHGAHTGLKWKLFMSTLEQYESKVDSKKVTQFARNLFEHLETWVYGGDKTHA